MSLEQSLLSEFAKAVNGNKNEQSSSDKFIRGTAKTIGGKKYVQLDGSNVTTPISETVDVEDGDRVLVSIENHKATILGNFTFPPSARKEQEAIDKAEDAQNGSNLASQKAEEAIGKATQADEKASSASAQANEAVQKSQEALTHADEANKNVTEAKTKAEQAVQDANTAKENAAQAQADVANANAEIEKINKEVTTVKGDVTGALGQLTTQASEIEAIKETYSTKVETETVKADLTTEISKKVGELQTTVEQNYAAKNDVVAMEGKLQTQITQNAQGLSSQATKVEKLESDTAQAQADVSKALENAEKAQNSAITAQENAATAQAAADKAKAEADNAKKKAQESEDLALKAAIDARVADEALTAAKTALDEAKKNYDLIVSNPESTQEQIQQAQNAIETATANVNKALADAATAAYAAEKAQQAADKAVVDANAAKDTANNAQNKADAAEILANKAQADAEQAQQEVAALTKRVTTAETNINQNAEAIELNARKTTEIGDNLKNNYYNKEEFSAQMKIESDKISSTVSSKVTEEVGKIQIGGRNLLFYTAGEKLNTDYNEWRAKSETSNFNATLSGGIHKGCNVYQCSGAWSGLEFNFNVIVNRFNLKVGDTLTYSIECKTDDETHTNGVLLTANFTSDNTHSGFNHNSDFGIKKPYLNWVTLSHTFTYTQAVADKIAAGDILRMGYEVDTKPTAEGKYYYFACPKLEVGNKATDWTPAPEDMATNEQLDEGLDGLNTSITETKSSIEQLADQITHLIVDENGSSMMTQDENGWHFDMSSITGNIDAVKKGLDGAIADHMATEELVTGIKSTVDKVNKKTAYIDIESDGSGKPVMTLGSSESSFKVVITNESIDFMNGTNKVAYASGNRFYAPQMVTVNSMQIGENPGFRWERRANGNLGLVYVSS